MSIFDPNPEIEAEKARQRQALSEYFDFGPGGMLGFPDDAYNKQGQLKGGIGGMSPAQMALLTFGLSALSQPRYGNNARGGVGRAGLDALNVYNQRLAGVNQGRQQFLQNQRQAQQDQRQQGIDLQNKQLFDEKMSEALRKREERKARIEGFPELIKTMKENNVPKEKIANIQALFQSGDYDGAYQSARNVISTAQTTQFGELQTKEVPGGTVVFQASLDPNSKEYKYLGMVSTSANTKSYDKVLIGQNALDHMKGIDPQFELDGPLSSLKVELNPDKSLKDLKYVSGRTSALGSQDNQLLISTSQAFEGHPVTKKADEAIASYMALERLGTSNPLVPGKMGPADMAIIFGFMRTLDPTSVVRESEYETASGVGVGLPDRIVRAYFKAKEGDILLEETRNEIMRVARDSLLAKNPQMDAIRNQYISRADALGLDKNLMSSFIRDPFQVLRDNTTGPPRPPKKEKPEDISTVKSGDGASRILTRIGADVTPDNIQLLIKENEGIFAQDGTIPDAKNIGKTVVIPKEIKKAEVGEGDSSSKEIESELGLFD